MRPLSVCVCCVCVSQQDGYIRDPGRSIGGPGFTTGWGWSLVSASCHNWGLTGHSQKRLQLSSHFLHFHLFGYRPLSQAAFKSIKKTLILKRCALPGALCSGSGNMCSVLSPGSVLLSANGSLAFKSCARHEDVASFTAPEVQQGHNASTRTAAEKVGKTQTLPWHLWKKNATHGPGQAC